jgi:argininosuccinate lyase
MQEDKEPVFAAADNILLCVQAMTGMVKDFAAHKENMLRCANNGYATATDLADWLVRELNLPFRQAHHVTAKVVSFATAKKKMLHLLTLKELQSIEPKITQSVLEVLGVEQSVGSKNSFGGTAPSNVKKSVVEAKKRFGL